LKAKRRSFSCCAFAFSVSIGRIKTSFDFIVPKFSNFQISQFSN
jgi:hypothetical protein